MKTTFSRNKQGFTLIEILVTITIMMILAGVIVGGMGFVADRQARSTAELQVALLSRGIDEYRLDMGVHPGAGGPNDFGGNAAAPHGQNSRVLYRALFFEGWQARNNSDEQNPTAARTIYVPELDPTNNNQGWTGPSSSEFPPADSQITDPWGSQYRYRVGAHAVNPDFDLWSPGRDTNTQPGAGGNYNYDHRDNRDDIRNF